MKIGKSHIHSDERETIAAAQRGDRAAFKSLYDRYRDRVYNLIYYSMGDELSAEDVLQIVFVKVYRGLPRFRFEASFATWISPQTLNGDSSLPLVTDMNDWSPGYRKSFAPHGARGPILRAGDFSNSAANGASPKEIGGVGGNVGLLDGSVNWRPIAQMKSYQGSHLWGTDGCLAQW